MTTAIWIIAACEVIRIIQNWIMIRVSNSDAKKRAETYDEMKRADKRLTDGILEEYKRVHEEEKDASD